VGLAAHNYHASYDCLPAAYLPDRFGRPTNSWRMAILPFLERGEVYNQVNFHLTWDAEENRTVRFSRMNTFMRPEDASESGPPLTKFLAVVGPGTPFPGPTNTTFGQATDGMTSTILFGEVAESDILWSEPRDLLLGTMDFRINGARKRMGFGSPYHGGPRFLFMDGSVRVLEGTPPVGVIRALVTSTGGEILKDGPTGWTLGPSPRSEPED
jgi:hypothetical protein